MAYFNPQLTEEHRQRTAVRRSALFVTLLCALALNSTHADEGKTSCQKTLRIGVSLPLTAGAVSSGEAVKNSIILADEKYDSHNCVQFIFEDDQLLAKNTALIVNKFISVDHVDAIVIYGTPTSIAVGAAIEKNKIPTIALSILNKVVQDKIYIMKHWCSAERLNQAIEREAQRRGYKSVAIVSTQNDAMLGLRDLFLRNKVANVILDDEYTRDDNDFRTSIAKITTSRADAVYVLLYPPQTGVFVKQLRRQGFKGDAFGVHNIEDPQEIKSSGGAMIGMWLANGDETVGEEYHSAYRKRFRLEPALGGANGYDSAKMFIEASQQEGDLNAYLHNLKDFHGAFGTYSATSNNDFDFSAVVKVVEKDGFRKVEH
jgi:ABC-type branched-subunit amino acid transport system substrate-binding protein